MGIKNTLKLMGGQNQESIKLLAKEFNNIEDQILRVQKNQVEFEKYLIEIIKILKEK